MGQLTDKELQIIISLISIRLRYEARRKSKIVSNGVNLTQLKVLQLADIVEKLEKELNNR